MGKINLTIIFIEKSGDDNLRGKQTEVRAPSDWSILKLSKVFYQKIYGEYEGLEYQSTYITHKPIKEVTSEGGTIYIEKIQIQGVNMITVSIINKGGKTPIDPDPKSNNKKKNPIADPPLDPYFRPDFREKILESVRNFIDHDQLKSIHSTLWDTIKVAAIIICISVILLLVDIIFSDNQPPSILMLIDVSHIIILFVFMIYLIGSAVRAINDALPDPEVETLMRVVIILLVLGTFYLFYLILGWEEYPSLCLSIFIGLFTWILLHTVKLLHNHLKKNEKT